MKSVSIHVRVFGLGEWNISVVVVGTRDTSVPQIYICPTMGFGSGDRVHGGVAVTC